MSWRSGSPEAFAPFGIQGSMQFVVDHAEPELCLILGFDDYEDSGLQQDSRKASSASIAAWQVSSSISTIAWPSSLSEHLPASRSGSSADQAPDFLQSPDHLPALLLTLPPGLRLLILLGPLTSHDYNLLNPGKSKSVLWVLRLLLASLIRQLCIYRRCCYLLRHLHADQKFLQSLWPVSLPPKIWTNFRSLHSHQSCQIDLLGWG